MKRLKAYFIGILMAVAALSFSGCASMNGPITLDTVRTNVDWAMLRYHNRQEFGFLSTGEQDQVASAYKAYQTAFNQAIHDANMNYKAPAPPNVRQLSDKVIEVLASIP